MAACQYYIRGTEYRRSEGGKKLIDHIEKLIEAARADVGYLEKKSPHQLQDKTANAGHANYTKYGEWYGKNPASWCAQAVSKWAYDAGIPTTVIPKFQSCTVGLEWFKKEGRWHKRAGYTPKRGDIIFFQKGNDRHAGIVSGVENARVNTIEGNTSGGSTLVSNGGSVAEKSYSQSYTRIHGYGNPAYTEISTGGPKTVTVELSVLQTGDKGAQVRALQILLNGRGYSPGKPDGDFGPKTKKAVTAYQKAKGLSADGVVGAQTWTALLRS